MAAALANFKVASKRYADYVPMYIKQQLLNKLPGEVLKVAKAELGRDGSKSGAVEFARQLMAEDKAMAKHRMELLKRQKQLDYLEQKLAQL